MAKTIIVAGYGPGISAAVAEKFGAEGFQVAIVGRSADKLAAGVKALEAKGVKAMAFTANLGDPAAVAGMVEKVRGAFGPISVLEWTAFTPGNVAGDLLTAKPDEVRSLFEVSVVGLLAAVQALLPDLKSEKGAILVTNGGAGFVDPGMDAMLTQYGIMGLGVANAAKHKLVGLLAKKLEPDAIYVAEIMIAGIIKGTSFDQGNSPTIDPVTVANKYWELFTARKDLRATIK
ncbi:MAG: Short-chain dehydrogenase/reductase [Myxococcaceae bacterium]|jgi:NADP-dependent 3-hydroxy acid dehydrogenase YdfG|nr:Short-chain dehydrogenase/reductase [Myxococcaceae bacterium]